MALLKAKTKSGWVEGLPSSNQSISVFKSVPFAAPPVGDLRWKAPRPLQPWEGTLKAYKFADIAIQERFSSEGGNTFAKEEFFVIEPPMSEDCLYLNIWTPAHSEHDKLPVAIYIHGGAMRGGYSYLNAYDGDGFAKRGMVFVTIAYRLNVFGFMAHPLLTAEDPHHSSGNQAPLDQVAAIRWVRENIAAFGGDPNHIGIFGQSAGGMSVRWMCATPLTKGDFERAIIQSGGGVCYPREFSDRPLADLEIQGEKFFGFLGVKTLEEARALPADVILQGMRRFDRQVHPFVSTAAVDGYLLPESEVDIVRNNRHHAIDYMLGCTRDEMGPMGPLPTPEKIKADAYQTYGAAAAQYLEIVRPDDRAYYESEIHQHRITDEFLAGALCWCELQNKLGRKPSYMYYLTVQVPGYHMAFHSAEHHYVFQTLMRSKLPYTGRDFDLSNMLADYWANFLKTGNPNGGGLPKWDPYCPEAPLALALDYHPGMIRVPEKPNVKFMKEFVVSGQKLGY